MILAFFGHSDYRASREDEQRLLSFLEETVRDRPVQLFLGGYGAFDGFARNCGRAFQKTHPKAKLVLVTPYLNRGADDSYDAIVYPPLESVPPRFAISQRNRWMVEQADSTIFYIKRTLGGAFQAYQYAQKKKKPLFNLADWNG